MQSAIGWWKLSPIQAPVCPSCGGRRIVRTIVVCSSRRGFWFARHRTSKLNVVSREDSFATGLQQMDADVAAPAPGSGTLAGAVVALGKFDALHIGHRALAEQAAQMGAPVLLSFTGMGEILGWEKRLPLVAPCDRARVMLLWAAQCAGVVPGECSLEFGKVRHLSPQQFVEKLAVGLQVKGVVAGRNYRFGYKAAGDASELERLCTGWGLQVFVIDPVMDKFEQAPSVTGDAKDKGQVSSTRVRKALAEGNMKRVKNLLGRSHRLIMQLENATHDGGEELKVPLSSALNQPPAQGSYQCSVAFEGQSGNGNGILVPGWTTREVVITATEVIVRNLDEGLRTQQTHVSIEF